MITKAREWSVCACLVASSLLWASAKATSQTTTVDASPSHVRAVAEVIDERPMAYKSIDAVMDAKRDLVEVVRT